MNSTGTQQVIGVEALVRLCSESGELIPPDQFIELAEDTGLIVPLGRHVIESITPTPLPPPGVCPHVLNRS
jgi:EAL domain-containing protein (putative c-di-GMP-specific phosphodiesterase class I)